MSYSSRCKTLHNTEYGLTEPVKSLVSKNLMGARHGFTTCQVLNPTSTTISLAANATTAMAISLTDIE